jgi:hypothetical protein
LRYILIKLFFIGVTIPKNEQRPAIRTGAEVIDQIFGQAKTA